MVEEGVQYLLVVLAVWPIKSNDGIRRDGDRCWSRKRELKRCSVGDNWNNGRGSLKAIRPLHRFRKTLKVAHLLFMCDLSGRKTKLL